jgi:cobalt transporter subunit CbtA
MILLGEAPSARRGLIWGGCFFIAFSLAPALGLPPELPGMEAGALPFRQAWWFGTIATSLLGLWLILKVGKPVAILIGAIVMIAPHLVGAPLSVVPMNSAVPPELSARFVVNAMVVAAAMWLMIGSLAGLIWQRLERSAP